MIKGPKKRELSAQTILSVIAPYDIYRYYLGRDFYDGEALLSPFRKENNASFVMAVNKHGEWLHLDYARDDYRGNCFQFVQQLFNIDYNSALERIDVDFKLGIRTGKVSEFQRTYLIPSVETRKETRLQVKARKWKTSELDYWKVYGVEPGDFKQGDFRVYVPEEVWLNGRLLPTRNKLVFCYLFQSKWWKIYTPYGDKKDKWLPKWLSNVPTSVMYGLDKVKNCDKVIVTKSVKDLLALQKFGICVCGAQNESSMSISIDNIEYLKKNSSQIYVAFDSDVTGKQNSWYYTNTYGFKHLNTPDRLLSEGVKDFSGWIALEGQEAVRQHLLKKGII